MRDGDNRSKSVRKGFSALANISTEGRVPAPIPDAFVNVIRECTGIPSVLTFLLTWIALSCKRASDAPQERCSSRSVPIFIDPLDHVRRVIEIGMHDFAVLLPRVGAFAQNEQTRRFIILALPFSVLLHGALRAPFDDAGCGALSVMKHHAQTDIRRQCGLVVYAEAGRVSDG
jgi:hypothetical protein